MDIITRDYETEDRTWIKFHPNFSKSFYVEKAGYFDERPSIVTSVTQLLFLVLIPILSFHSPYAFLLFPLIFFGWGQLRINLPIKTGIQDCDSAAWGFNCHGNRLWWYIGGAGNFDGGRKWVTLRFPWDMEWVRTSTLLKDNTWYHKTFRNKYSKELDKDGLAIGSYEWIDKNKKTEEYPYTDIDGTELKVTISVREMEFRLLALKSFALFSKKIKSIDIEFSEEVGRGKGSWKGGVIGCGYNMKENETPLECLERMKIERKL